MYYTDTVKVIDNHTYQAVKKIAISRTYTGKSKGSFMLKVSVLISVKVDIVSVVIVRLKDSKATSVV